MDERNGIPKFDLAEQIMAEQRKNASVKRRGPASKAQYPKQKPGFNPFDQAAKPQPLSLGQEQVIADIVARDIERLCRSSV